MPVFLTGMGAMTTVLDQVTIGFMLSWVEVAMLLYDTTIDLIALELKNGRKSDCLLRQLSVMTIPASQDQRTCQPHRRARLADPLANRTAPTGSVATSTTPKAWRISSITIAMTRWGHMATWPTVMLLSSFRLR